MLKKIIKLVSDNGIKGFILRNSLSFVIQKKFKPQTTSFSRSELAFETFLLKIYSLLGSDWTVSLLKHCKINMPNTRNGQNDP